MAFGDNTNKLTREELEKKRNARLNQMAGASTGAATPQTVQTENQVTIQAPVTEKPAAAPVEEESTASAESSEEKKITTKPATKTKKTKQKGSAKGTAKTITIDPVTDMAAFMYAKAQNMTFKDLTTEALNEYLKKRAPEFLEIAKQVKG